MGNEEENENVKDKKDYVLQNVLGINSFLVRIYKEKDEETTVDLDEPVHYIVYTEEQEDAESLAFQKAGLDDTTKGTRCYKDLVKTNTMANVQNNPCDLTNRATDHLSKQAKDQVAS